MPSVGPFRLARFLASFGAQHPRIELTVSEGEAARLEELLLSGSLDVAVSVRIGPANARLRHQPLYRESVVAIFPPAHRFARQDNVRLIDFKGENFLLRANCEMRALVFDSCRKQGFQPTIIYRSERDDWIQMMVAAGRGVTLMPENMHFGHGTLARPLIEPSLHREIALVTVAGRPQDPPVQRFVRAMRAHKWDDETSSARGRAYQLRLSSNAPSIAAKAD
jgi:DNA-binding transcriptional LysR family regulator